MDICFTSSAFQILNLLKTSSYLKIAEENSRRLIVDVRRFHLKSLEILLNCSPDLESNIKLYLSVILYAIRKIQTLQDGVIFGEPDLAHQSSVHRTLFGSFGQPNQSGELLSLKSIAGYWFLKNETQTGIKREAVQLVTEAMQLEVTGSEIRNIRLLVDDCYEAMDSSDKFIENFTTRLQVWFSMIVGMIHEVVSITHGKILHSLDFRTFKISNDSFVIETHDIVLDMKLIEETLWN